MGSFLMWSQMKQPSKNFEFDEFVVSKEKPSLAKKIVLNEVDKIKIFYGCVLLLQPIRDTFGYIEILSSKRSEELNKAVDGSENSDHLYKNECIAFDFTCPNENMAFVYNWCKEYLKGRYGQLLFYKSKSFLHISLPSEKHFNETLVIK